MDTDAIQNDFLAAIVDEDASPAMILRGRIVCLDEASSILADGRLLLRDGFIHAVLAADEPIPDDFATAPEFDTGATLYPGLMDLHNHFAYNFLPPWLVPRLYRNRREWPGHARYKSEISLPMRALASRKHTSAAIVRYVEAKALIGGVTSGQGIKTQVKGGSKLFKGAMRNVEQTGDERLPQANTLVPDLFMDDQSVATFRRKLEAASAYFYHLSEGVDQSARKRFLELAERDLLAPALVGIHGLGLAPVDLKLLAEKGAKLIWSPLSNLLLYGKTLDLKAVKEAGVTFCIGCDWSPSGSRNLLQELKVAAWENQRQDAGLSAEQLVRAVTIDAAKVTAWEKRLGSLEVGKFADVLALEGDGDPYQQLIDATESAVVGLWIHGVPRYGRAALLAELPKPEGARLEAVQVAGREMAFNFQVKGSSLNNFGLAKAQELLETSLADLQGFLAQDIADDSDFLGTGLDMADEELDFTLELDMDHFEATPEEDGNAFLSFDPDSMLALDYTKMVDRLALDPLTVGPGSYFEALRAQPNLPDGFAAHLSQKYGYPPQVFDDQTAPGDAF